jgi:hypothetical protein
MTTQKWEAAAITSLMTTELNSLANGSTAIASAGYDNATNLYLFGLFELNVTFGSAPTAGNTVDLFLVPAPDGTNYDDGSGSVTPPITCYAGGFPLRAVTTAQKIPLGGPLSLLWLPPLPFKVVVKNGSGQAFPASGSTLKMVAYRYQSA